MSLDRRSFLKRTGVAGPSCSARGWPGPGSAVAQDMTLRPIRRPSARHAALRCTQRAGAFDVHQCGTEPNIGRRARYDTLLRRTRRRADDHPDLASAGDLAGRQEVHVPPAQRRQVPRRRRLHARGRQGDL